MKKAEHNMDRQQVRHFQQIINVGPATEQDFHVLGLSRPQQLIRRDPWKLYSNLCHATETIHDPCVLDVIIAEVDFMNGNPPKKWWSYTAGRKKKYAEKLKAFQPCRLE